MLCMTSQEKYKERRLVKCNKWTQIPSTVKRLYDRYLQLTGGSVYVHWKPHKSHYLGVGVRVGIKEHFME